MQRHISWLGRAMACNLPRFSRAEIALARSDEPHVSSISTKKLSLRIYDIKIRPDEHDIVLIISGKWLDTSWYRGSRQGFRGIGYVNVELNKRNYYSFKIFPRFGLVETTRIIHHNQLLFTKCRELFCHFFLQFYFKKKSQVLVHT